MSACKPCSTTVDLHSKLSADGPPVDDATQYYSLARALQYLIFTHPDIAFAVQQICLYMHDPLESPTSRPSSASCATYRALCPLD